MCNPKPLLRCSNYAIKHLQLAQANHAENPTPASQLRLEQAQRNFLLTPAGIRLLLTQGKSELATELENRRHSINSAAKRYRKFSADTSQVGERWLGDEKFSPNLTSPIINKAYNIAVIAHEGVDRLSGEPYINHPLRVAQNLRRQGYNDEVVAVALLHDSVEDSDLTLEDLRNFGFNDRIITGVDSVTKRDGEAYPETIDRASQHPIGQVVKLEDNLDNSSEEQLLPFSPQKRAKQISKYTPARKTLLKAIRLTQESLELLRPSLGFANKSYRLRTAHTDS